MALHHDRAVRLKTVGWTLLTLLFLLSVPLLLSASPWLLAASFLLGAGVVAALAWLLARLRRRSSPHRWPQALAGGMVATALIALPLYWLVLQPALRPLAVPRVTLGDGQRQVVFQGMTHIGSAPFYRSVAFDLMRTREAGYKVYFEGVMPGTPEAQAWFRDELAGGGDLNAEYGKLAGFCGLHFQNDFLGFVGTDAVKDPARTVNADVTETEMWEEWKRLVAARPELADQLVKEHPPSDDGGSSGMNHVMQVLSHVGDRQRDFVGAACRGIFTFALQGKERPDVLNAVVLDFRNRKLAERIAADAGRNLYLIYGSGHFPGLFHALKQQNPAWRIEGVTSSTAIEAPEDAVGRLELLDPER
ncbi:hypothetical protein [Pseudoxanthomonas sp.]|jgi:hypothetical protein|uniref:hypothetical protein n=1 Tax=Pseudoxanthomonas sp. TaxID=1871049 RepID=UPI002E11C416|nr:hypothetical protein [Pseudoxanthomonas sp.]